MLAKGVYDLVIGSQIWSLRGAVKVASRRTAETVWYGYTRMISKK
jgi:hypothetical protein